MSVTYNYCGLLIGSGVDLREGASEGRLGAASLHGKIAREMVPILEAAIDKLGTERSENYWEATPGNAGYALWVLLGWARLSPDARFRCG